VAPSGRDPVASIGYPLKASHCVLGEDWGKPGLAPAPTCGRWFAAKRCAAKFSLVSDPSPNRSSPPLLTLDVVRRDDSHVLLAYTNLLIVIWCGHQHPDVCRSIYDSAISVANQTGLGKVAAVSIVQPGIKPPSTKAREALGRLIEDEVRVIHRSALVYLEDGFIASIVRSIALNLMQRSARKTHRVFQELDKALEWVTDGLPRSHRLLPLTPLLRELESHLAPYRSKVA